MVRQLGKCITVTYILVTGMGCGIMGNPTGSERSSPGALSTKKNVKVDQRKGILRSYQSDVSKHDGITQAEAKLLAQSEIIFRGYDDEYRVAEPRVMKDEGGSHWGILFYPINKTMYDALHKPNVLIRVKKSNGDIHWEQIQK